MYCPNCGSENRDDSLFCGACGADLSAADNYADTNSYVEKRKNLLPVAVIFWTLFVLLALVGMYFVMKTPLIDDSKDKPSQEQAYSSEKSGNETVDTDDNDSDSYSESDTVSGDDSDVVTFKNPDADSVVKRQDSDEDDDSNINESSGTASNDKAERYDRRLNNLISRKDNYMADTSLSKEQQVAKMKAVYDDFEKLLNDVYKDLHRNVLSEDEFVRLRADEREWYPRKDAAKAAAKKSYGELEMYKVGCEEVGDRCEYLISLIR